MALKHPFHRAFSLFMAFLTIISKARKPLAPQSEIAYLGTLELQLELVRNQGDELTIGGLALGVGHGVAEEPLEGVQITTIPSNLNGVANGPFYPAGCGAEVLGYLGVEHLGDGVRVPGGPRRGYQEPSKRERDRQRLIVFFIALFATASQGLTI